MHQEVSVRRTLSQVTASDTPDWSSWRYEEFENIGVEEATKGGISSSLVSTITNYGMSKQICGKVS